LVKGGVKSPPAKWLRLMEHFQVMQDSSKTAFNSPSPERGLPQIRKGRA